MDAETWPRVLFQYGPFAILVFLIFFVLRRAQDNKDRALASTDRPNQREARFIYIAVWTATFACIAVAVYVWMSTHSQRFTLLRGDLSNLRRDDRVQFERDEVYSQSFLVANTDRQKVEWVFVSDDPLSGVTEISFTHEAAGQTARRFTLRVPLDAQTGRVRALYVAGDGTFRIDLPGGAQVLTPSER